MTILITGGSKGIGRAIAARFAADGDEVLINYHNDDDAAGQAADQVRAAGGTATLIKADLGDVDGLADLVAQVSERVDRLDQVVHGAVLPVSSAAMELDVATFQRATWINGAVLLPLVQGLRPLLGDGSSIVVPGYVSIGAPKAMAEAIMRYLAVELAPDGIRANTIVASGVLTDAVRSV